MRGLGLGLGLSLSARSGGAVAVAAAQSGNVGADTLANAYAFQLLDTNGSPKTGCTITGGTATFANFSISGSWITPDNNGAFAGEGGNTLTGTDSAGNAFTFTIGTVAANTYSVGTHLQLNSAFIAITSAGGKTVSFIKGSNSTAYNSRIGVYAFVSPVTVTGETGAILNGGISFERVSNLVIEGLNIIFEDGTKGDATLGFYGSCFDITVQDNIIEGVARDPLADYSSTNYVNPRGIGTVTASGVGFSGIIRRNEFKNLMDGINISVTHADGIEITDNLSHRIYNDVRKYTVTGDGLTAPKIIQRNITYDYLGIPTDVEEPHSDTDQFVSSAANDGLDLTNLIYRQNAAFTTPATSRGTGMQGLTAFVDGGNAVVIKDPIIAGNIFAIDNIPLTLGTVDGGTYANNLIVRPSNGHTPAGAATMALGAVSSAGTIYVNKNIADTYSLGGAATYSQDGNVTLGVEGATIAYTTQFDGSTFPAASWSEVKTKWATVSGTAGPLGSGYGVYADVLDATGWSYDASYESTYAQSLVDTQGTAYLSTPGAFGGNEPALTFSLWLTPQVVSGTQYLYQTGGRSYMRLANGALYIELKDTGNNTCYSSNSTGAIASVGVPMHFYVAADFANDTLVIEVDGSAVSMVSSVSTFASTTGLIDMDAGIFLLSSSSGTSLFDTYVSDITIYNSIVSNASLYNGGEPPDPTGVGSPLLLLGGDMTADERAGNSSQGWNDGYNLGSGGALTVGSGTYADV